MSSDEEGGPQPDDYEEEEEEEVNEQERHHQYEQDENIIEDASSHDIWKGKKKIFILYFVRKKAVIFKLFSCNLEMLRDADT